MRLIDADALEESLKNSCKDTYETKMFVDFMSYVDEAPTIEQSEECISRKSVVEWLERCTDDSIEHAIDTNLDFIPSVTPSYNSIKTELKPCEECISREEAKKLIQGKIDDIPKNKDGTYGSMFGQYVNGLYCAKTAISYMSSVVPQTKRGNWIETKDECEGVNFYDFSFECSKCGKEQSFRSNYCPNCGADMRESEEEK